MKKLIKASIIIAVITFPISALSCGKKGVSPLEIAKIMAAQEGKTFF